MVYEVFLYKEMVTLTSLINLKSMIKKNEGSLKSMGFQILN